MNIPVTFERETAQPVEIERIIMKSDQHVLCPNCQTWIVVNAASMLARVKTSKRAVAARRNGRLGGRPVLPPGVKGNYTKRED